LKTRIAKGQRPTRIDIIRFDVLFRHTIHCIHLTLETSLRFFAPSRRSRTEAITLFSCYSITLLFPVVSVPALRKKGERAIQKERERERERERREKERKNAELISIISSNFSSNTCNDRLLESRHFFPHTCPQQPSLLASSWSTRDYFARAIDPVIPEHSLIQSSAHASC